MSSNSATGSSALSVKKWVIDSDVENQLRSEVLWRRLQDKRLSHGSIRIYLRCSIITAIGLGEQKPFVDCPSLLRVDLTGLPKLESIPRFCFRGCIHLELLLFCDSLLTISDHACRGCFKLSQITLPNKINVLESGTFGMCHALESVVFNDKLQIVRENAFARCTSLESFSFPDQLTTIEKLAFSKCESIKVLTFKSNLATLGVAVFQNCTSLAFVDFSLCSELTRLNENTFIECHSLERVVFNKNLKTIGEAAFQHCYALKRLTLPDKLKVIETHAFVECTSIERVVCNKNLKIIGYLAFSACSKLEDIQLASSSISFGDAPFFVCDRLIELAAAAGFPSNTNFTNEEYGDEANTGDGVVPYLIDRFERSERKRFVLLAQIRFKNAVHAHDGDEKKKVAAAQQHHPRPASMPVPTCFTCKAKRRPTRKLSLCAGCNKTYFCNKQCQIVGWKKHKVACKRARKRKKLDYSKDKFLVGELLSVVMRGGGQKGVLGTILSYI